MESLRQRIRWKAARTTSGTPDPRGDLRGDEGRRQVGKKERVSRSARASRATCWSRSGHRGQRRQWRTPMALVRNTPKSLFVGPTERPTPLTDDEVRRS